MFVSLVSRCLPVRFYPSTSRCRQPFGLLCSPCVETLFEFLAVLQIAAGLFLLLQGIQWLSYVPRRLRTDPGFFAPPAAGLCPFRGRETRPQGHLVSPFAFRQQEFV